MSKDITDADLLDAERQNIARERAASSAHKDFTPHFEFLVGDTFSITDAATADDDTEAFADTYNITDDVERTIIQPSGQFQAAGDFCNSDQEPGNFIGGTGNFHKIQRGIVDFSDVG